MTPKGSTMDSTTPAPQAPRLPIIPNHEDEGKQSIVLCPRDFRIHHATRTPKGERRCGGCGRKAV